MTIFSKNIVLKATCCEVVHTYDPSCVRASLLAFYWAFKNSIGLYTGLYAVSVEEFVNKQN